MKLNGVIEISGISLRIINKSGLQKFEDGALGKPKFHKMLCLACLYAVMAIQANLKNEVNQPYNTDKANIDGCIMHSSSGHKHDHQCL